MSPEEDAHLSAQMRAALSGDENAYAALLRSVANRLRPVIRRKLAPATDLDPEDIVQEALLAIYQKRHTWRTDAPIGPWLYAIARYKVIDAFRRRGRTLALDIADMENDLISEQPEHVDRQQILRAVDDLPAGQRKVVAAIGIDGRSISDTAATLGMKETAVRVAFHRGLMALAKRFGTTTP